MRCARPKIDFTLFTCAAAGRARTTSSIITLTPQNRARIGTNLKGHVPELSLSAWADLDNQRLNVNSSVGHCRPELGRVLSKIRLIRSASFVSI